jgi:hypothetical protein
LVVALGATEMPVFLLCGIRTRFQKAVRAFLSNEARLNDLRHLLIAGFSSLQNPALEMGLVV